MEFAALAAVPIEYEQHQWTKEQGLPDDRVRAILQTHEGYLWIATRRYLARFDGLKFRRFDPLKTPELSNENSRSLAEDINGSLWIGTTSYLFQQTGNEFSLRANGNFHFSTMCPSRFGGVWFGSPYQGLIRVRGPDLYEQFHDGDLPGLGVFAVEEDENGVLWVGTISGLLRREPESGRFETVDTDEHLAQLTVVALRRGSKGELWVLFAERRPEKGWFGSNAWLACLKDGRWLRRPQSNRPDLTIDPRSAFIATDHFGNLWLPSAGGGLNRFAKGEFTFHKFSGAAEDDFPLCVHEDRQGDLWIGTERSGLLRWRPRRISTYTTADGLPHNNIWTICEAGDASVWIGTDGGFSRLSKGRLTNFSTEEGLSNNRVRALAADQTGTVWIGTGDRLNELRSGRLSQTDFPYLPQRTKIRVVLAGREDTLWMGYIDGLHRLQNGKWSSYSVANGLANDDVRALLEDRAGNLWIGTAGGGVQRFRDGKFTTFSTTNGLSNNLAWALHEESNGVIWVGTENGLNRLQDDHIAVFTTNQGLPVNLVNYILEDDFGRLWVSHDHGIYWMNKHELEEIAAGRAQFVRCVAYGKPDGLLSLETNGQVSNPAGCKTRDGRLWFPTTEGVAVINPKTVAEDLLPPLTAIESIRANGQVILETGPPVTEPSGTTNFAPNQTSRSRAGLGNLQTQTGIHRFAAGNARVLEFDYTANTFVAPEQTRFKYRMLGLNENWIDAGTRRKAYFADLRPGDYQFEVIAANHHGVWPVRGVTFAFQVAPFFYQGWWFRLSAAGVLLLMGYGIYFERMRRLRRIQQLEQQAALAGERARIAKDLHDGLGADLTRLAMLADLATGAPGGGTGEHLLKLSQSSRSAARELKELIWLARPANDTVDALVSRLCLSAEEFLRDARIPCRLNIAPNLPEHLLAIEQRRNLLLIVREALHNIVKHAGATEVCFRAWGNGDNLQLGIEDNGRGFDPGIAHPDGLGLSSMRQRIEDLGGTFSLESRLGSGTRILIELPLRKKQ